MGTNEGQKKNSKSVRGKAKRYTLTTMIPEDQREYVEGVREWLRDSLRNKKKIVGGPI